MPSAIGTEIRRGDVVIVVAQGDIGKPRPAVVVQANELNARGRAIIVCPLSSDLGETESFRPLLEPSPKNGLRVRSQIMTDKISSLGRSRVRSKIGELDDVEIRSLDGSLALALGLAG